VTVFVDEQRASEARALSQLMTDVLTAIENTYLSAGVSLPDRRYWLMGEPVVDCEQLTVGFIQACIGPPGDEASTPQNCDAVKTAVLQVQVWRCVPVAGPKGKQPMASAIQSAATPLAIDAYLLLDSSRSMEMWDPMGGPGMGVIATVETIPAQGGYEGVTLNLTLAIP
jgi:hypothetical protein